MISGSLARSTAAFHGRSGIVGPNGCEWHHPGHDMSPEAEFALGPDLHFIGLLSGGLLRPSGPARQRVGDRSLTSLRSAVLELLEMEPAIGSDWAILRAHADDPLAWLDDIVTGLEPDHPSLGRTGFFLELAARVWKATPVIFIFQPSENHHSVLFDLNTFGYEPFRDTGDIPGKNKTHGQDILRGASLGLSEASPR